MGEPELEIVYVCRVCKVTRNIDGAICHDCGARGSLERLERARARRPPPFGGRFQARRDEEALEEDEDDEEEGPTSSEDDEEAEGPPRFVRLGTAKLVPIQRISTGIPGLDHVLGGDGAPGAMAAGAISLAGDQGAGKSSILLTACSNVTRAGHVATYASCEGEGIERIRALAGRIGLKRGDLMGIHFVDLSDVDPKNDRLGYFLEQSAALGARLSVIDSLPLVVRDPHNPRQIGAAAKRTSRWAQQHTVAAFMIAHLTGAHAIAGGRLGQYLGDGSFLLERIGVDKQTNEQLVRFKCGGKNRGGWTTAEAFFRVGKGGFEEYDPDDEQRARRREKQDAAAAGGQMIGEKPWDASRAPGRRRPTPRT